MAAPNSHFTPTPTMNWISIWIRILLLALPITTLRSGDLWGAAASNTTALPEQAEARHLTMTIGSTQEVSYPLGTDLAISRRGIIDVFHLGDGRWQITALRPGFVVVDAHDGGTGAARMPRLFIDARRSEDELRPGPKESEEETRPIPKWICQDTEAVTCGQDSGLVTGTVASPIWFHQARASCQASPRCTFAVVLTATAQAEWTSALRLALGADYSVTPTARGSVLAIIETYCGKGGRDARLPMVDALTSRALSSGLAWFKCREDRGLPHYRMHAQVFLVEAAAAAELGFANTATVQAGLFGGGQNHVQLLAKLKALEQERKAEIVGEPMLRLTANQPAELASGGEFQVTQRTLHRGEGEDAIEKVAWKQHGLTLKLVATPLNDQRVRLGFDMTLKSRSEGSDQALTLHVLKSEADLILGVATMAGILDLQTSASEQERLPVLSKIPLIGPWFQRSGRQSSKSRLFLWLELSEDESRGDMPQGLPLGHPPQL